MEIEDKTDSKEFDDFLRVMVEALEALRQKLAYDPVFTRQIGETRVYENLKRVRELSSSILDNPDRPKISSFTTQQG